MTMLGLKVFESRYLPEGTFAFVSRGCVVGFSTKERRDFLALFGLEEGPPAGTDAVMLSPADYARAINATISLDANLETSAQ